jgi:hypothetical protein
MRFTPCDVLRSFVTIVLCEDVILTCAIGSAGSHRTLFREPFHTFHDIVFHALSLVTPVTDSRVHPCVVALPPSIPSCPFNYSTTPSATHPTVLQTHIAQVDALVDMHASVMEQLHEEFGEGVQVCETHSALPLTTTALLLCQLHVPTRHGRLAQDITSVCDALLCLLGGVPCCCACVP